MAFTCYNRYFVKNPIVSFDLPRKALQGVPCALDLITDKQSVDYRHINPRLTLAESKFFDDESICFSGVLLRN